MKNEKGVILAYITVCIVWGSTYLAMRIAVGSFPPELFAGMRFLLAGTIVMAYAVVTKKAFPSTGKDVVKSAIPGVLMLMGSNGLVMWAEQWVHSGITSLLLSVTPLFVALIEVIVLRDTKIGFTGWICLIMGFTGTAMLVVSGSGVGSIDIKGGLMVLTAAFLWSLGSIYSNRVKYTGNIATHIGIQMLTAGAGLTIMGVLLGEVQKVSISTDVVLALAYLVIFGSVAGYSCNMYVLSKWPASKAITSAYVNPVVAVLLGVVILDEKINPAMVLCMIITLGSVVLLHYIKYGKRNV
ncbi:EamA family transporter [Pseudobacteroides cellulosolvens]|uniref:EamA domain-containing protein n=1 Tax=Pseudobacteroides cellulosolvens ATCC 35603 = DSM 2933 TaxID=398512 RepID=A0A0L6JV38_9FIRM|nr:EamA family transporter [Pseudobacteroides cellulosolvens]KNY29287.1 protein of unknown function DUF6 transmembrane [Pseudobacteroides cellulosolvens ATCC 35603 = DSM 2933]